MLAVWSRIQVGASSGLREMRWLVVVGIFSLTLHYLPAAHSADAGFGVGDYYFLPSTDLR